MILIYLIIQFSRTLVCDRKFAQYADENPRKTQPIVKLTLLYLICVLIWSVTMTVSRSVILLLGKNYEACIAAPMYCIIIIIGKLTIFVIFMARIKASFKHLDFEYPSKMLYTISILVAVAYCASFIFAIMYLEHLYGRFDDEICTVSPSQLLIAGFPIVFVDTFSWFVIWWLFLLKLHQVLFIFCLYV